MEKNDAALEQALAKAIEEAGGPTELAAFITEHFGKITPQAICDWRVCPPRRVAQVEAAVRAKGGKTTARALCPALFEGLAAA